MANMAKRAQAIRVDVNAREKVAKMLDNRKIMDQCRCMHRDERNGIALKSNGQENSDVRICAVCGKPIKMKRVTFEEVNEAVKTLDVYLDQQKLIRVQVQLMSRSTVWLVFSKTSFISAS